MDGIWAREERDVINSPEVCCPLGNLYCLLSALAPHQLKCIIATGICREPVVRVTFIIKKIKGLWVGPGAAGIVSVGESRKILVSSS